MPRTDWPETEIVQVRRETSNGETGLFLGAPWPEHIVVTDDWLRNVDARWVRCTEQSIWIILDNGSAQYRVVERDPDFDMTLCILEDWTVF